MCSFYFCVLDVLFAFGVLVMFLAFSAYGVFICFNWAGYVLMFSICYLFVVFELCSVPPRAVAALFVLFDFHALVVRFMFVLCVFFLVVCLRRVLNFCCVRCMFIFFDFACGLYVSVF